MKKFLLLITLFCSTVYANTLEFTVMHAAGGVSDIVTRFLAKETSSNLTVVNRPGAAGKIAMGHLMSEKTILLATMPQVFVTNPLNFKDLNYDPLVDLDVIATVGVMPSALLCNNKTGIESVKDLQSYTKPLTFAVGGYGSSEHVSTEVLLKKVKVNGIIVPYAQGGNKSVMDLLGGHVDCMFGNFPTIKAYTNNPSVKLILTSHNMGLNSATWEKEFREPFPLQNYLSVIAPKTMDQEIKKKITLDFTQAFQKTEFSNSLRELGVFPRSSTDAQEIQKSLKANDAIKKFILDNNIRVSQ